MIQMETIIFLNYLSVHYTAEFPILRITQTQKEN